MYQKNIFNPTALNNTEKNIGLLVSTRIIELNSNELSINVYQSQRMIVISAGSEDRNAVGISLNTIPVGFGLLPFRLPKSIIFGAIQSDPLQISRLTIFSNDFFQDINLCGPGRNIWRIVITREAPKMRANYFNNFSCPDSLPMPGTLTSATITPATKALDWSKNFQSDVRAVKNAIFGCVVPFYNGQRYCKTSDVLKIGRFLER